MHDTYSASLRVHEIFARTEVLYTNENMLDIQMRCWHIGTLNAKHDLIWPSSGLLLGFYHLNMSVLSRHLFMTFVVFILCYILHLSIIVLMSMTELGSKGIWLQAQCLENRQSLIWDGAFCILFLFMCFFTHRRLS